LRYAGLVYLLGMVLGEIHLCSRHYQMLETGAIKEFDINGDVAFKPALLQFCHHYDNDDIEYDVMNECLSDKALNDGFKSFVCLVKTDGDEVIRKDCYEADNDRLDRCFKRGFLRNGVQICDSHQPHQVDFDELNTDKYGVGVQHPVLHCIFKKFLDFSYESMEECMLKHSNQHGPRQTCIFKLQLDTIKAKKCFSLSKEPFGVCYYEAKSDVQKAKIQRVDADPFTGTYICNTVESHIVFWNTIEGYDIGQSFPRGTGCMKTKQQFDSKGMQHCLDAKQRKGKKQTKGNRFFSSWKFWENWRARSEKSVNSPDEFRDDSLDADDGLGLCIFDTVEDTITTKRCFKTTVSESQECYRENCLNDRYAG